MNTYLFPWLALAGVVAGPNSLPPESLPAQSPRVRLTAPETAEVWWDRGQAAIRRQDAAEALRCYQLSLQADPTLSRNYLSIAAAYLQTGRLSESCAALSRYTELNPSHVAVRVQRAELLHRLRRADEARAELEHVIADVQQRPDPDLPTLSNCHRRLMDLAEEADDRYAEHLHRGIGLYLLARQRASLPDEEGAISREALLCKAAAELTLARRRGPREPRPAWYLSVVWSSLSQPVLAEKYSRAAAESAPFSGLTPAETRDLLLTRAEAESRRGCQK